MMLKRATESAETLVAVGREVDQSLVPAGISDYAEAYHLKRRKPALLYADGWLEAWFHKGC